MYIIKSISAFLMTSVLFTGCRETVQSIPLPTTKEIKQDTARIKLIRTSEFIGGGISPTILDNGVMIGDIGNSDGQLLWDRPEGNVCLTDGNNERWGRHKSCFFAKGGQLTNVTYNINKGFLLHNFDAIRKDMIIIDNNKQESNF